jgi:hypothetical protein
MKSFSRGGAITVGHNATTHGKLDGVTAAFADINAVATAGMNTFATNLNTPPDQALNFPTGSSCTFVVGNCGR